MAEPTALEVKSSRYSAYITIAEDIWEGIYNAGLRSQFSEPMPYDVGEQAWPLIYEHFEINPELKEKFIYGTTVMLALALKNNIVLSRKGIPDVRYKDAGVLFIAGNIAGMLIDSKAKPRV